MSISSQSILLFIDLLLVIKLYIPWEGEGAIMKIWNKNTGPDFNIDANHYDFSVIVMNFGPKLRFYGQQSTCYGFPIIAGPEPFPI